MAPMSHLIQQEIACPHCKHPVEAELWSAMNVHEDPELKDLLLGGEINMVECDACHEVFYAEAFVLYHDPDNELMAMVYPSEQKEMRELLVEKSLADFEASQATLPGNERLSYKPVCLFGLNDLVGLVEAVEEEALQSEVTEAIAKERHLAIRRLRPFVARSQQLPRVLPVDESKAANPRQSVIGGLERLKSINDRLTLYNDALARLTAAPGAEIRFQ